MTIALKQELAKQEKVRIFESKGWAIDRITDGNQILIYGRLGKSNTLITIFNKEAN